MVPPGLLGAELAGSDVSGDGTAPHVLYTSNPDGYQNLPLLYRAFALLRRRRPSVRLLLAGHHAPAAFARELDQAPSRAGIEILRCRDLNHLRHLLAAAQVGVCTRVLRAGAPIKVLNYIAAGLPMVACQTGAEPQPTPEQGRLMPPRAATLAAALDAVLASPRPLPPRCADAALGRFSLLRQLPAYERAYAELCPVTGS